MFQENPTPKLPPDVIQSEEPDAESRYRSQLDTKGKVTWSWLKKKFGSLPKEHTGKDYFSGRWGDLYIEVRAFDDQGKYIDDLERRFESDELKAAQRYAITIINDEQAWGARLDGILHKYWHHEHGAAALRVLGLGAFEHRAWTPREEALLRADAKGHSMAPWSGDNTSCTKCGADLHWVPTSSGGRGEGHAMGFSCRVMRENATIHTRRYQIRGGLLRVMKEATGPGGRIYLIPLEYYLYDIETGEPPSGDADIVGEWRSDDVLVVGDPHRDVRLYEYKISGPTSESKDFWSGYRQALEDRQWHQEGKSKKHYAQSRHWWDGYNEGHRDKRDSNRSFEPNATSPRYWVWVLDYRGVPKDEGPYGPHNLTSAEQYARISATNGDHDRAVSLGRDPEGHAFRIISRYRRGTGERML